MERDREREPEDGPHREAPAEDGGGGGTSYTGRSGAGAPVPAEGVTRDEDAERTDSPQGREPTRGAPDSQRTDR